MSWSSRRRGNVQRTQMKKNMSTPSFAKYHATPAHAGPGPCQPPKNSVTAIELMTIMFMYSPRKNSAHFIDEYSVWKPATSSPSASGRSNGARFVSANAVMRKIPNGASRYQWKMPQFGSQSGVPGIWYQPAWRSTMPTSDSVPARRITGIVESPMASSYRSEDAPVGQPERRARNLVPARLALDDADERQRPRAEDHRDRGEPHGELVRDHLGRRSQGTEQRVLVVRRPAAERDGVDADARHGEEQQQPDVDVGAHEPRRGTHRDHGERHDGRGHREDGRDVEDDLVRLRRDELLLEEELDDVGDGLQEPERPDAVGAGARLDVPADLALGVDQVGHHPEQRIEDDEHLDQRPRRDLHGGDAPQRGHPGESLPSRPVPRRGPCAASRAGRLRSAHPAG